TLFRSYSTGSHDWVDWGKRNSNCSECRGWIGVCQRCIASLASSYQYCTVCKLLSGLSNGQRKKKLRPSSRTPAEGILPHQKINALEKESGIINPLALRSS